MTALRWEPTHVTKPDPRVVPLHITAGLSQETDTPPDNDRIADAWTHCHVF